MTSLLEATLHPAWYHGHRTKPPYFYKGTGHSAGLEVAGDIARLLS